MLSAYAMQRLLLFLTTVAAVSASMNMSIQYTTNGEAKLNILNITFHTVSLNVKLLGCDYGYYDLYLLFPPTPSWQTEVTPFNCVECECEDFERERAEQFVVA
jgi:hypothetical protein